MNISILPINFDDLLHCRGVESERVEFKASWNPATTGPQVLRTICAFANDYHNLNGGYVVVGVEERDGRAALPPVGLSAEQVDAAQKWIHGNCNHLDPPYQPILSPERLDDRLVLVLWAPASDLRWGWPEAGNALKEICGLFPRKCVAHDDITDAIVAAVTARAKANSLSHLPTEPQHDSEGLPMQMIRAARETIRFRLATSET